MSIQFLAISAVLILSVAATACSPQPAAQPAAAMESKPTQAMMDQPAGSMDTGPTATPVMMDKPAATMAANPTPAATMPATGKDNMAALPKWFSLPIKDARSGETFMITDFLGKVVLLEDMATWCPNCMSQQQEVKKLHANLGMRADLVTLGVGVDLKEDAPLLKSYIEKNGFDWKYAIATSEVAHALGASYGDQYLNPSATPMLIIDRQGQVHTLPFGIKSAAALQTALQPFLDAK